MKCRVCKRALKNPDAIREGIGRVCKRKLGLCASTKKVAKKGDIIEPYDGGKIWIEKASINQARTNVPRQIYKHSPNGYRFESNEVAFDFALNICLLFCKHADDAYRLYKYLTDEFICSVEGERLTIQREQIETFLKENGAELKEMDIFVLKDY